MAAVVAVVTALIGGVPAVSAPVRADSTAHAPTVPLQVQHREGRALAVVDSTPPSGKPPRHFQHPEERALTLVDSTPQAPKLPLYPAPPVGAAPDEPARALPATTTVCRDPATSRCWVVAGESTCTTADVPAAEPFRIVIGHPGEAGPEAALAECRTPPAD